MRLVYRPPLLILAIGLLGLILMLASLQYVWLGRISEAERERLQATLASRAAEFAQDFDRELARAYLLFQTDTARPAEDAGARFAERYDRWQATSAYPRILKDFHVAARRASGDLTLVRFDPAARALQPSSWPASMADWRSRLDGPVDHPRGESGLVIRRLAAPIWETVPALVVPAPLLFLSERSEPPSFPAPEFAYTLLTLDMEYIRKELLPTLTHRHFRKAGEPREYHVAVVDQAGGGELVFRSNTGFSPRDAAHGDAAAALFQVRSQDFSAVAAEVRRFATFTSTRIERHVETGDGRAPISGRGPTQMSILVQKGSTPDGPSHGALGAAAGRVTTGAPRWQVIVKHPAGSLEAYVGSTRRRNLIISTSILAVLAASMALLIVSTRRSQKLARQQLEFVAAVSHELRTPLAVIRSAGENLADGVVDDGEQVRQYGSVIRAEGRRLSEMVEQILELSGIQSGQRGFARRPVLVQPLVDDVVATSRALLEEARIRVDVDMPASLPPVDGDEVALRRVFQNLIGNAIKYGAAGGWIGVRGRELGGYVQVSVSDKGIGIAPGEQARIFEPFYRAPDVVDARIQGAGLGLSLVHRIVEGHGGRVSVKSIPGAGSEFVVMLPISRGEAAEAVQTSAEATQSP